MRRMLQVTSGSLMLVLAFMAGFRGIRLGPVSVRAAVDAGQPAYFSENVQPVLQANCYRCHGGANHRGGFNMETRDSLLKGGHHGPAVVPGHPEQSLLLKLIRHEGPVDDPMNMPPDPKPKIADADIAMIEGWIKAGAVMPPAPPATAVPPATK